MADATPLELKNKYTGDFITIYGATQKELDSLFAVKAMVTAHTAISEEMSQPPAKPSTIDLSGVKPPSAEVKLSR